MCIVLPNISSRCMLMKDKGETTEAFKVLQALQDECQKTKDQPVEKPHFFVRFVSFIFDKRRLNMLAMS